MALPQEVCQEIFTVIEGGAQLGEPAKIIQFTSDNGANTWNAVKNTYQGSNGTGFEYWVAATITLVEGVRTAVSAGAAYLAMEVGSFGLMAAPALGLTTGYLAGNWLYSLSPDFWARVEDRMVAAGLTVNRKIMGCMDATGIMSFPPEAIEIFKNSLLEENVFVHATDLNDFSDVTLEGNYSTPWHVYSHSVSLYYHSGSVAPYETVKTSISVNTLNLKVGGTDVAPIVRRFFASTSPFTFAYISGMDPITDPALTNTASQFSYNGNIFYGFSTQDTLYTKHNDAELELFINTPEISTSGDYNVNDHTEILYKVSGVTGNINPGMQQGATYPDPNYFPDLYPNWHPVEFPNIGGEELPNTYPLQYPDILPNEEPYQDDSQDPDPDNPEMPDQIVRTIEDPNNDPNRKVDEDTDTETDTDEGVDPEDQEDIDDPVYPDPGPDPVDPDPPVPPTPIPPIPIPPLPTTVNSSKLFTVYNPSSSALDQLGGYLWDNDLIDILRKIWQNPLDGIISLIQVYCTPTTSGSHNIILGYLDSGVSAPVVSNQFVTIDCGSITVPERNKNCTDYVPYTSMELYLPFIGIVEIDTNEFMGGTINIKYKVDVYTGTCLAEVKCTRTSDMVNGAILYTYSGNCSQQLPLTSGDARGVLSTLVSAAGAGISIASGGSFGVMAGARMISANIGREMLHVSHSGNLSANAGIMGQKKPYLIINRDRPYNANSYNKFYGYPCNKTVYLINYFGLGYVRVKACRLRTKATQSEKDEILELLKEGVIL